MSARKNIFGTINLVFVMLCLFTASNVFAATSAVNYRLLKDELAQKLKADTSNEAATVELKNVEEYKISKREVGLKGDAVYIAADNRLPVQFEAKIDTLNEKVAEVNYSFVEISAAEYAPTSNEEILMKELMTKISRDYKTTNIVIAIENYEEVGVLPSEKKLLGVGEVRIGDMVWNNIKFDVSLDAATQKAVNIVYRIEK